MNKDTDKNMCKDDLYPKHEPSGYPGVTPSLQKDFGNKADADLQNGFVPQVRPTATKL